MVGAAQHMSDTHIDVVHHDAEVIRGVVVGSKQDEVFNRVTIDRNLAEHRVVISNLSFGNSETNCALVTIRMAGLEELLCRGAVQVGSLRLIVGPFIPVAGPSMSWRRECLASCLHSNGLVSVSSIRRRKTPLCFRAKSQSNSAVLAPPT